MRNKLSRAFVGIALFGLLFSLVGPAMLATAATPTQYRDLTSKHWAFGTINTWINWGLVGGYSDNTFRPSQPITKAEFLAFANRGFGFTQTTAISFSDVKPTAWYAGDVAKAIANGYATANADGTFQPSKPLTRLEAAQMLYKILRLEPLAENKIANFTDVGSLSEADRAVVNAIVGNGYLVGYGNTLRLSNTLTRAEMVCILARGAGEIMQTAAATYGPATGTRTLNGNATINRAGITLQNTTVKGDLYITEGVGDGDFNLVNVTVLGRTIVAGGGRHSGHASGQSNLGTMILTRADGTRMEFTPPACPEGVVFRAPGDLEFTGDSEAIFDVVITSDLPAGTSISFVGGNYGTITNNAAGISYEVGAGATAANVVNSESAAGSTANIAGAVTGAVTNAAPGLTTNVAPTATVNNVTNTETAAGARTNVSGHVTGTVENRAPNTATTVAAGSSVSNIVNAATATGASATIAGAVGQLQTSAPITITVAGQGTVQQVQLQPGAGGSSVVTEQGAARPPVTAPADMTWDNNGQQTSGSSSGGGTSGGGTGGGDPGGDTPTYTSVSISSVQLLYGGGSSVSAQLQNNGSYLIDISTLTGNPLFTGMRVSTVPSGCTLNVTEVYALGDWRTISRTYTLANETLSAADLIDLISDTIDVDLSLAVQVAMGSNQDVSLENLRGVLGAQVGLRGTLTKVVSGNTITSGAKEIMVNVGGDDSSLHATTQWGNISFNRTTGNATFTPTSTSTQLGGRDEVLISVLVAAAAGLHPDQLENVTVQLLNSSGDVVGTYSPYSIDDAMALVSDLTALMGGVEWNNSTMGDLIASLVKLKVNRPGVTEYTISFVAP